MEVVDPSLSPEFTTPAKALQLFTTKYYCCGINESIDCFDPQQLGGTLNPRTKQFPPGIRLVAMPESIDQWSPARIWKNKWVLCERITPGQNPLVEMHQVPQPEHDTAHLLTAFCQILQMIATDS